MSTFIGDNTAVDAEEFDLLVARTVQAKRESLGVSAAELAKASGISRAGIEAIERGGATTRADRYDIAVAMEWLSNSCAARRLTRQPPAVPRIED